MNEEELLAALDSNEAAFDDSKLQSITKSDSKPGFKPRGEDLWKKDDFKSKKLSVEEFKKSGKSFTVAYYGRDDKVSDDVINKFAKIAKYLSTKGFTFRHHGRSSSKLQNEILAISDIKVQSYLPWSKFNTNIKKPVTRNTRLEAYEYACNYHAKFNSVPATVRAMLGNEITVLFTEKFNDPVDLIVCYNEKGDEVITRGVDYKDLGNISFFLKVAADNNIPVFNLGKEDAITRIVEFVKNMDDNK